MEQVLKEIINIEATAKAIIEDAAVKKTALSQAMEEEKAAFDSELSERTEQEMEEIRKQISEKQQLQLDTLKKETEDAIHVLDSFIEENRDQIVETLVQQVLNE